MSEHTRNLAVIAHVDHGKTTLVDSLVKAGKMSNKERAMDAGRKDQVDRNITIVSTGASLKIEELSVNLIDTPGHVDFSPQVSAGLRLTDGCLVVVDAAAGVSVQTITVLKQSLAEAVRPVLVLNKLDRLFLELQLTGEEIFVRLGAIVEQVNGILAMYSSLGGFSPPILSPASGNVIFASGKQSWGFTLPQLAKMYAAKLDKPVESILLGLWGEMFQDSVTRKWSKRFSQGKERGFCKYVMNPIVEAYKAFSKSSDFGVFERVLLEPLGIEPKEIKGGSVGAQMSQHLPLHAALTLTIREHLPSPGVAQKYRAALLYTGPAKDDDAVYRGIEACDPKGPLVIYVAKLTPGENNSHWAFGRVLSGTVTRSSKVHFVGPTFDPSLGKHQADVHENVTVSSIAAPRGADTTSVDSMSAGHLVLLGQVDKYINRTCTIIGAEIPIENVFPIKGMKFTVSAVVARSVKAKKTGDLAAFQKALARVQKLDNLVAISFDSHSQETVIAGAGELHLEVVLNDLQRLAKGIELVIGNPVVALRETCIGSNKEAPALAKSSNKLNRVYTAAEPLHHDLVKFLDESELPSDQKERNALLNERNEWDLDGRNPKRIWAVGGEAGANALTDDSSSVAFSETQGFFVTAFNKFANHDGGPLCGEPVQGVRMRVCDAKLHQDKSHRGAGEMLDACRRSFTGSLLSSEPRLLEPMLRATIELPRDLAGSIYNFRGARRARVVSETPSAVLPVTVFVANLPALESLGFDSALRAATSGAAFCSLEFSHWQLIDSDPLEEGTQANKLMLEKRKQKGLNPTINVESFLDRL